LLDQTSEEVLLILGKGDETFQIIYDQKFPFDDREVVRELLGSSL
jgi:UDP-N-acetylmuramoyl-L-alanyl-D-glutamate--2,6-diaminopimelate ligase